MKKAGDALRQARLFSELPTAADAEPEFLITRVAARKAELIEVARKNRAEGRQELGYSSRPFIMCSLPVRPCKDPVYVRRNGKFFLRITPDPEFGLPYGHDRLIPIWIATLAKKQGTKVLRFRSGSDMLKTLGLARNGKNYRRIIEGIQRVFTSSIFWGTEEQLKAQKVWEWTRFHYIDKMRLWKTEKGDDFPGDDCENIIVLSEEFWKEIQYHGVPVDLKVVQVLASKPAALDFFMWASYRWYRAKTTEAIPLFGPDSLSSQLGVSYKNSRVLRWKLKSWVKTVKVFWPEFDVTVTEDDMFVLNKPAGAIGTDYILPRT